jgi:hypothetical protein
MTTAGASASLPRALEGRAGIVRVIALRVDRFIQLQQLTCLLQHGRMRPLLQSSPSPAGVWDSLAAAMISATASKLCVRWSSGAGSVAVRTSPVAGPRHQSENRVCSGWMRTCGYARLPITRFRDLPFRPSAVYRFFHSTLRPGVSLHGGVSVMTKPSEQQAPTGHADSTYPDPENLTDEQSEILDRAALVVIRARREAADMVRRAGLEGFDDDFFGSRCRKCNTCEEFWGEGDVCERNSCRHSASQHAT